MSNLTHLQAVNKVLTHLREATVGSITAGTYSAVIGEYVQQAREKVEDSWPWPALGVQFDWTLDSAHPTTANLNNNVTLPASIVVATALTNFAVVRYANGRSYIQKDTDGNPIVWDMTTNAPYANPLKELSRGDYFSTASVGYGTTYKGPSPIYFDFIKETTDLYIQVLPNLNATVVMRARLIVPQDELTDNDAIYVPWRPVISYAIAMALEERGEVLGPQGQRYWDKGDDELAKAISQVSHPDQFVMVPD